MTSHHITTIGLDADDTLWHNERYFRLTQQRLSALLADYADPDHLDERLLETERRNIGHYGYGVKGFTLSMIETALEVTEGKTPGHIISQILEAGREMLSHPIDPLPHVLETLEILAADFQLIVITKGDLYDQERKLAQSGLDHFFHAVEIVSEKTPNAYTRIFNAHGTGANRALMAGNSLKSDVIPALQAGAWGVHIPHELTFALEHAEPPLAEVRFRQIDTLAALPKLMHIISGA